MVKPLIVQTPGAQRPDPSEQLPAQDDGEALPPDLQAKVDAAIARGVAAALKRPAAAPAPKPAAVLPRYADTEAAKPTSPVLTDEGWYVPAGHGTPAHVNKT